MNINLSKLQPYPFEKLRALTGDITPANMDPIFWSIGEPKHAVPDFLGDVLKNNIGKYANYPTTGGTEELLEAIASWTKIRFKLDEKTQFSADKNIIPVNGTREALFAIVQALFDSTDEADEVWLPNPFYQIYEGAALLAGAKHRFLNCSAQFNYQPDFESIPESDWQKCQMMFICTPGNPSGSTLSMTQLQFIIQKSIEHDFLILSDECYSELYRDENNPPVGLLQAASNMGHHSLDNCLAFHSLSKRSNLPGLRSGFVAGDAHCIKQFLRYRTYHGCSMPIPHQAVSIAAWQDETHVAENRRLYNEKYQAVYDELKSVMPITIPDASFYLWPNLQEDDEQVAKKWLQQANIRVLPGQYLSREVDGINPGYGHVRIALVATVDECVDAAKRLKKLY